MPAAAPAPPGRRERTKAANRAAILGAARDVFAEHGYDGAAVRHIVARTTG
jgi:AcrR family transcriptional regulator